jgi:hypothetical protein
MVTAMWSVSKHWHVQIEMGGDLDSERRGHGEGDEPGRGAQAHLQPLGQAAQLALPGSDTCIGNNLVYKLIATAG